MSSQHSNCVTNFGCKYLGSLVLGHGEHSPVEAGVAVGDAEAGRCEGPDVADRGRQTRPVRAPLGHRPAAKGCVMRNITFKLIIKSELLQKRDYEEERFFCLSALNRLGNY